MLRRATDKPVVISMLREYSRRNSGCQRQWSAGRFGKRAKYPQIPIGKRRPRLRDTIDAMHPALLEIKVKKKNNKVVGTFGFVLSPLEEILKQVDAFQIKKL